MHGHGVLLVPATVLALAPGTALAAPTPAASLQAQATASPNQVRVGGKVVGAGSVAGVRVQVSWDGRPTTTVLTGSDGTWSASIRLGAGQEPSNHTVDVQADVSGQQLHRELTVATVAAQASRLTDVRVAPADPRAGDRIVFSGKLLDAKGHPVADRQVQVAPFGATGYLETDMTGADGSFHIDTQVPLGTKPARLSPVVDFPGDETYRAARNSVALTVRPGGGAAWTPPPVATTADPGSGGPAPAPTLISPASPRAQASTVAVTPSRDALPHGLRIAMAALAGLGLLVGLVVASRQVRSDDGDYDKLIG